MLALCKHTGAMRAARAALAPVRTLCELATPEMATPEMNFSTTESIPGKTIKQYVGFAEGSTVRSKNVGHDVLASTRRHSRDCTRHRDADLTANRAQASNRSWAASLHLIRTFSARPERRLWRGWRRMPQARERTPWSGCGWLAAASPRGRLRFLHMARRFG